MKSVKKSKPKGQNQAVVFDLGSLWLKGLHVAIKDGRPTLLNFICEKQAEGYYENPESLSQSINSLTERLGTPTKKAVVALNGANSVLKQTMMPVVPLEDMRKMLKVGSQNYLGQALDKHTFDCEPVNSGSADDAGLQIEGFDDNDPRKRVLVGGSQELVIKNLKAAMKKTRFTLDHVVPNQVGIINAFESAYPEIYSSSTVAIIEVGHAYSSICVIDGGTPGIVRNINFGGRDLNREIADHLNITTEEAQNLKEGLADEVDDFIEDRLESFVNEIQASMDFFTHTQERDIQKVFVSGGSLMSNTVFRVIATNLIIPSEMWNPMMGIDVRLPIGAQNEVDKYEKQLGTSIGAALAFLN